MLETACHNIATWYEYSPAFCIDWLTTLQSEGTTLLQEQRLN